MGAGVSRRRSGVTRWAVFHDIHLPEIDWPTWRCAKQWIAAYRPERLLLGGDIFDLETMGRFEQGGDRDPQVLPELRAGVRELNDVIACADETTYLLGNHEKRWWNTLCGNAPRQLQGLVGLSFAEQLYAQGLDPRCSIIEEKAGWPGVAIGHVYFRHGDHDFKGGGPIHVAHKLLGEEGGSASIGHVHRTQLWVQGRPGRRTEYGMTGGTMQRQPKWGTRCRWSRGWQAFEVDDETGYAHPYPILCEAGRVAWGGQVFDGNEGSTVGAQRAKPKTKKAWGPRRMIDGTPIAQVAREHGLSYSTLCDRFDAGVTGAALLAPADPKMGAIRRGVGQGA